MHFVIVAMHRCLAGEEELVSSQSVSTYAAVKLDWVRFRARVFSSSESCATSFVQLYVRTCLLRLDARH